MLGPVSIAMKLVKWHPLKEVLWCVLPVSVVKVERREEEDRDPSQHRLQSGTQSQLAGYLEGKSWDSISSF